MVSYQDENTSALMMVITSSQWLALRMTLLCSLMVAAAGYGAVLVAQSPGLFFLGTPSRGGSRKFRKGVTGTLNSSIQLDRIQRKKRAAAPSANP